MTDATTLYWEVLGTILDRVKVLCDETGVDDEIYLNLGAVCGCACVLAAWCGDGRVGVAQKWRELLEKAPAIGTDPQPADDLVDLTSAYLSAMGVPAASPPSATPRTDPGYYVANFVGLRSSEEGDSVPPPTPARSRRLCVVIALSCVVLWFGLR